MLSAVAARRAAQAAQTAEQSHENQPIASTSTSTPTPPSHSPKPKPLKRKPSSQKTRSEPKKPRKVKPTAKPSGAQPAVAFDDFENQAELIELDSDMDEDGSDSAMSVLEDFEADVLPKPSEKAAGKRAWSPSQPIPDSSDESDDVDDEAIASLDVTSLLPHLSRPSRSSAVEPEEGRVLSTFVARPEQNLFVLTEEELASLGLSSETTVVALTEEDTLCLLGTCSLAVLHGSIDILGTTLSACPAFHPIYAPRSAPLPLLKPADGTASALVSDKLSARLKCLLEFKTVIALQELINDVEGLGLVCRTFEGVFRPSRWQKSSTESPFDIPGLYLVRQQTKECCIYSLPPSWSSALNGVLVSSDDTSCRSYLIKGPKNSGKSTFARNLINRLLKTYQRVAFLECDLGQSEFTPGGMVALNIISEPIFGPPFTHPTLPNHAHFVGSNTPRSSPSYYLDAVHALIQTYRLDIQTPAVDVDEDDPRIFETIPIVVNTMGWSKGLGADLTQRIESLLEPTDIFDIQVPGKDDYGFSVPGPVSGQSAGYAAYHDHSMMEETSARVHVLEPVELSSALSGYTAADHRSLSILSYFHARFPTNARVKPLEQVTAKSWDVSRPLCAVPPFQVDCVVAFDKVILIGAGSEDVVEEEIGRVLNGAIVAFVRCEPGMIDADPSLPDGKSTSTAGIPYSRYQLPPSPALSNCVGLGLIRGVSPPIEISEKENTHTFKTYLQILTPLPHSLLAGSRVLVKGELELPIWGMLDFRTFDGKDADMGRVGKFDRDNMPYLQWGKAPEGALGADRRKVRRNLMRRGQM